MPLDDNSVLNRLAALERQMRKRTWIEPTAYACAWTATSSNPAIGNGTLRSYYSQRGGVVQVWLALTAGSTTTFGSGVWLFSLPVTPATYPRFTVGPAQMLDAGTADYTGVARLDASVPNFRVIYSGGGAVSSSVPHTWASTDVLALSLAYLAAQ